MPSEVTVSMSAPPADESSEEASFYEILPCCARFRCGELIDEGQWHHLVLVMSKGMLKNSMASLYLDGQLVNTVKVRAPAPKGPLSKVDRRGRQDVSFVVSRTNGEHPPPVGTN